MHARSGRKWQLGAIVVAVGWLILTGGGRAIESAVIAVCPDWLTDATTAI